MADYQTPCHQAIAEEKKSSLILGMIRIVNQAGMIVKKNRLCLLERDAMLNLVGTRFPPVPGKFNIAQSIILAISLHPAGGKTF